MKMDGMLFLEGNIHLPILGFHMTSRAIVPLNKEMTDHGCVPDKPFGNLLPFSCKCFLFLRTGLVYENQQFRSCNVKMLPH